MHIHMYVYIYIYILLYLSVCGCGWVGVYGWVHVVYLGGFHKPYGRRA